MTAAGFEEIEVVDVTKEFERVARVWHEGYTTHQDELRPLLGDELDDLCKDRAELIAGVAEGLLERHLVAGSKP